MSVRYAVPDLIKISLQNQEIFLYAQPCKKKSVLDFSFRSLLLAPPDGGSHENLN